MDLVRATAARYDAVIASVFVRAASGSGRMDPPANMQNLLRAIARQTGQSGKPFVVVFFGNPYTATFLQDVPAMLLTYDLYDRAERSAVKALAGESPITRKGANRAAGPCGARRRAGAAPNGSGILEVSPRP